MRITSVIANIIHDFKRGGPALSVTMTKNSLDMPEGTKYWGCSSNRAWPDPSLNTRLGKGSGHVRLVL